MTEGNNPKHNEENKNFLFQSKRADIDIRVKNMRAHVAEWETFLSAVNLDALKVDSSGNPLFTTAQSDEILGLAGKVISDIEKYKNVERIKENFEDFKADVGLLLSASSNILSRMYQENYGKYFSSGVLSEEGHRFADKVSQHLDVASEFQGNKENKQEHDALLNRFKELESVTNGLIDYKAKTSQRHK